MVIGSIAPSCSARALVAIFVQAPTTMSRFSATIRVLIGMSPGHSLRSAEILMETGAFISAKPFETAAYDEQTSFMQAVRRDGREVA